MGLTKLKVKCKVKKSRGMVDAMHIMLALKEHWNDLKEALENLSKEEQDAFKDHFNNCIDGEQGLGEILFDSYDSFESRIKFMDEELQEEYA